MVATLSAEGEATLRVPPSEATMTGLGLLLRKHLVNKQKKRPIRARWRPQARHGQPGHKSLCSEVRAIYLTVHFQAWGRRRQESAVVLALLGSLWAGAAWPQFPHYFQDSCFPQIPVPLFDFPLAIPEPPQTPNTHFPFLSRRQREERQVEAEPWVSCVVWLRGQGN